MSLEVDGLLELVFVVVRNDVVVGIQQIALAVALVHRAKHPAVAVEIGELRVLELRVEFGRAEFFQEIEVLP